MILYFICLYLLKDYNMKPIISILFFSLYSVITPAQVNIPAYVPGGSLKGWWPFSGNAVDSSGNGNDGTVYGCTLAADRFGNANSAYNFDGISNYIYIPANPSFVHSLELTKDVSIAAWVKSTVYNPSSGQAQIFWRGDTSPAHDPYMLYLISGNLDFRRDIDPGGTITNEIGFSTSIIDVSLWHHVAGTYNFTSGVMKIYYDGNLQNEATLPGNISYALSTYWNDIGAVDNGTWQFFTGLIDDVGAWDRELDQCEISKLYLSISSLITGQPVNDTVLAGGTATFSISDTGAGTPTYQWEENSGSGFIDLTDTPPYSGVTTKTLTINPVAASDSGNLYRCIRTGSTTGVCIDTSNTGTLIVRSTTGLKTPDEEISVSLVPNPNSGAFTINGYCGANAGEMTLEITNVLGQTVYLDKIMPANGKVNKRFYLNNTITDGVYLARIHSGTKDKILQLVIKK